MPKIQKKTKSSNVLKFSFTETLKSVAEMVRLSRVTSPVSKPRGKDRKKGSFE